MKHRIPKGGFFAGKYKNRSFEDIEHRLRKSGAQYFVLYDQGLVLASWIEFRGQGLWTGENMAVAYDLDLTNEDELNNLSDLRQHGQRDPGRLLWALYRKFGLDFVDRLRGAFGFALWDGV
ncbi:MAG: hypothetical protein SV375_14715, partial [Thermodesulfobacteriota bacterium]|nr:hypothetical protein [Thermodesulfobacteriota bacterium]